MKRFHAHIAVANIDTSIDFYSKLFGQPPKTLRTDYAKWMLEDPRINFAISTRGHAAGLNHFGFQVESAEELAELKTLANAASGGDLLQQGNTVCCYARSEKHWTVDPQGLAWEHFLTLSEEQEFSNDSTGQTGACCIPLHHSEEHAADCCVPNETSKPQGDCCD